MLSGKEKIVWWHTTFSNLQINFYLTHLLTLYSWTFFLMNKVMNEWMLILHQKTWNKLWKPKTQPCLFLLGWFLSTSGNSLIPGRQDSKFLQIFLRGPGSLYTPSPNTNICVYYCIQFTTPITNFYECLAFNILALEMAKS